MYRWCSAMLCNVMHACNMSMYACVYAGTWVGKLAGICLCALWPRYMDTRTLACAFGVCMLIYMCRPTSMLAHITHSLDNLLTHQDNETGHESRICSSRQLEMLISLYFLHQYICKTYSIHTYISPTYVHTYTHTHHT